MANEIGFTLCRTPRGQIVRGPMATGTPTRVQIPVACPSGTAFFGLFHTHPGGVARPSAQDIASAQRVGAEVICVASDTELRCFGVKKTVRP